MPPEHHKLGKKTGKPLLRPIIPQIKPLIEEAMKLSGIHTHMFLNAQEDEPMGKGAPLALPYNIMQWLRRHEKYEMAHWSVHDLRKTARTNFSTLTQPHVAEVMLGHRLPGTWQTYDHYTYLKEQAAAYSAWWQRLTELTRCLGFGVRTLALSFFPRRNLIRIPEIEASRMPDAGWREWVLRAFHASENRPARAAKSLPKILCRVVNVCHDASLRRMYRVEHSSGKHPCRGCCRSQQRRPDRSAARSTPVRCRQCAARKSFANQRISSERNQPIPRP